MVGINDVALINIYTQLCDKKNQDNQNAYLVQAAQRFQQLGLNYRAIQIVHGLELQNVHSNSLTDTKFLIAAKFANDALVQMREKESRSLSPELTYPAAKFLTADLQKSMPVKDETPATSVHVKPAATKPRARAVTAHKPQVTKAASHSSSKTQSDPAPAKTAANPFGSLVKNP